MKKRSDYGMEPGLILKQVDLFSSQPYQSLRCNSTFRICFYWCHVNWTPDLSRTESEDLVWGSTVSHWAWGLSLTAWCLLRASLLRAWGRASWERMAATQCTRVGLYLLQSVLHLPFWPWQLPGEGGLAGSIIPAPQKRRPKLTQAGGEMPGWKHLPLAHHGDLSALT